MSTRLSVKFYIQAHRSQAYKYSRRDWLGSSSEKKNLCLTWSQSPKSYIVIGFFFLIHTINIVTPHTGNNQSELVLN